MKKWPVLVNFGLFIALCASSAYWAMQLFKPPVRSVAAPPQIAAAPLNLDAAAGLFGGRSAQVAVTTNFQLKGVVVSATPQDSVAILVADGKPAQAVGQYEEVMPGVIVKEIHAQHVLLLENGVTKRVDLPENAKPQIKVDAVNNPAAPTVPFNASPPSLNQNAPSEEPAQVRPKQLSGNVTIHNGHGQ